MTRTLIALALAAIAGGITAHLMGLAYPSPESLTFLNHWEFWALVIIIGIFNGLVSAGDN